MKKRYFPIITNDECKGCGRCVIACPKGVLGLGSALNAAGLPFVSVENEEACTGCSLCFYTCPEPGAIRIAEEKEDE